MSNFDAVTRDHESPATDTWQEAAEIGADGARDAWAEAARPVLIEAAQRYHSVVTYKELAAQVQERTRIRTSQRMQHWIGDVLKRVAHECTSRDEPNFASLCVNAQGSVGAGYGAAGDAKAATEPTDVDDDAARERLACYRFFEATGLPTDGGVASLTPQMSATRSRNRKAALAARVIATCPTCHMALPGTGVCDGCS